MIRWLLDTDHISLNERGHPAVQARLAAVPPDASAVSVITMEEMIRGRLAVLARHSKGETRIIAYRNFMETVLFFGTIPVIPFDSRCEKKFHELRSLRLRVGTQDLRIAATALVNDLTLVTGNQKHFGQVPQLALEDWTADA